MAIFGNTETRVNSHTDGYQYDQQITRLPTGGWVVTWTSDGQDGSGFGIFQKRFDANGQAIGDEIRVNTYTHGSQTNPQVSLIEDALGNFAGWVVAWTSSGQDLSHYGVYQQVFDANGGTISQEQQLNVQTSGFQGSPRVTGLDGGGWVVTWVSEGQDTDGYGIYQKAFLPDGQSLTGEEQVNSWTEGWQTDQIVTALEGGGWIVTWASDKQDGSGLGIYQQRYGSNGFAIGPEVQVNIEAGDHQIPTQVSSLAGGGWLVTFVSHGDVWQRIYESDGSASAEIKVNTTVLDIQYSPKVTLLGDEGWVVTWTSNEQDGSGGGVYQQAFDKDGAKIGSETQVNAIAQGYQYEPKIVSLAGGGWVVTWISEGQDGSGAGLYQKAYNANGEVVGEEARINSYTAGSQSNHEVIALSDGRWVVAWESENQDGSGPGVYQRTFWLNEAPVALDDTGTVAKYATLSGNVLTGAGADSDADANPLQITAVSGSGTAVGKALVGAYGRLTLKADGTYSYAADTTKPVAVGQVAEDVFTYTISDGKGGTDTAKLTISVSGVSTGTETANSLLGSTAVDTLRGLGGKDTLVGDAGNDRLIGGLGADTLTGGLGKDVFIFATIKESTVAAGGRDKIVDFNRAQVDKIDVKLIDANTKMGGNQAFTFIGKTAFTKTAGELRYQKVGADTHITGDINGDGRADFTLVSDKIVNFVKGDFIL